MPRTPAHNFFGPCPQLIFEAVRRGLYFLIERRYQPRISSAARTFLLRSVMAAKPTPDEIANIIDAGTLAEWCGFSSVAPAAPTGHTGPALVSPLEAFHVGLGLGPTEHFRVIASLSPADFTTGIIGMRFNGSPPTMKERGAMQLFHSTARRLCLL